MAFHCYTFLYYCWSLDLCSLHYSDQALTTYQKVQTTEVQCVCVTRIIIPVAFYFSLVKAPQHSPSGTVPVTKAATSDPEEDDTKATESVDKDSEQQDSCRKPCYTHSLDLNPTQDFSLPIALT